jgi:hypothetical protein
MASDCERQAALQFAMLYLENPGRMQVSHVACFRGYKCNRRRAIVLSGFLSQPAHIGTPLAVRSHQRNFRTTLEVRRARLDLGR